MGDSILYTNQIHYTFIANLLFFTGLTWYFLNRLVICFEAFCHMSFFTKFHGNSSDSCWGICCKRKSQGTPLYSLVCYELPLYKTVLPANVFKEVKWLQELWLKWKHFLGNKVPHYSTPWHSLAGSRSWKGEWKTLSLKYFFFSGNFNTAKCSVNNP